MNENINSKINFLRVTIKRNLEAIGEVLSSEETSNYHNEPEDIISEINFLKVIIERNLKKVREALETEETSNYNHEPKESDKIVEKTLRANSRRNLRVELLVSKYTYEENVEHKCYLAGKSKEMKAMFASSQSRFSKLENSFNELRIKFINRQQYYKK